MIVKRKISCIRRLAQCLLHGRLLHGRLLHDRREAMDRLNIRRATRDDLTAILRIEKASFLRDAWTREQFRGYLSDPVNCIFLVAVKGAVIAGYAIGFHTGTRSELDSIAVAPAHRSSGIAAALMRRLMALMRRRGVSTMSLMVRLDNTAAITLYRKLGFRRERRVNDYYEDGAPAWRMKASLPPCTV